MLTFFWPCIERRSKGGVLVAYGDTFKWHLEGEGIQTPLTSENSLKLLYVPASKLGEGGMEKRSKECMCYSVLFFFFLIKGQRKIPFVGETYLTD